MERRYAPTCRARCMQALVTNSTCALAVFHAIIRKSIAKSETKMSNVEGIVLKMLDRWNRSDETSQRHREDIVKELNDVTDDLAYLKGRINSD